MKTKTHHNPPAKDKTRAKRQAALAELGKHQGDIITPEQPQELYEADPDMLAGTVKSELQRRRVGELVSSAIKHRNIGVRALARKVKRSHSQIVALEQASNMELSTLILLADSLEFDVEIRLKPREGGEALAAQLG